MKLLLHACCGPCLIEPLDGLRSEYDVTVLFGNPNIQPAEEHELRRLTLLAYAEQADASVIETPYEPQRWLAVVGDETPRPDRCRECYRLRLGAAARAAADAGFDAFATTLTVSPYQDAEAIRAAGEAAAAEAAVRYVHRDFRDRYRDGVARARELGLYRQNYCGCLTSREEAERERTERRAARLAGRSARRTGKGSA